jgi:hypothetical protein
MLFELNLIQEKFLQEECKLYVVICAEYFIFIFLGCDGSWCVGLTILPPSCADSIEILEALKFLNPKSLPRPVMEWEGLTMPMYNPQNSQLFRFNHMNKIYFMLNNHRIFLILICNETT